MRPFHCSGAGSQTSMPMPSDQERAVFADLLEEQDVDIMAWAIGTAEAPERFAGPMIDDLKRLDYVRIAR